jgi:hypothetical protein
MRKLLEGRGRLWLVLLATATVAAGGYAISPAIGGGGKLLTKKRAKRIFYPRAEADARFAPAGSSYSKSESETRFAPLGSSYSKSESDARYLSPTGDTRLSVDPNHWDEQFGGGLSVQRFSGSVVFSAGGALSNQFANQSLEVPQLQFGIPLRVVAFELCYETANNSTLDEISLRRVTATAAVPVGSPVDLIDDPTNRTDNSCRTYTAPSPIPIGPEDTLHLLATLDFSAAGTLRFTRTTLILRP